MINVMFYRLRNYVSKSVHNKHYFPNTCARLDFVETGDKMLHNTLLFRTKSPIVLLSDLFCSFSFLIQHPQ